MKILYLESVDSTQKYLKKLLSAKKVLTPYAVVANMQTAGVGSRDNSWTGIDGNLFLSFAISIDSLTQDLKLESASIYFSYLLKKVLNNFNSSVWLKWPNDFYIDNIKIGGMITNIVGENLICGVGMNLVNSPKEFGSLDIHISKEMLLKEYFKLIEKRVSWKQVFSKYKVEFERNQSFFTHNNSLKISLDKAILQSDGSIIINGERIYSTR
ncbi:MAG: BirA family biotin operon repressor/biotin-[acetyl-CoA-carboxylase] ligase [Sulfurimonas sp.]|uniref:biotin--[acetyl-CoA-carboxylase] ligase n=1 Tax=Sulfurimonas sp. TaxID=2022749 RepID=UPI0039E4D73A